MQHFTPQFSRVNIAETVRKELSFLQQPIDDKNLKVNNEIPENFLQDTDENFLSVIIRNLLQNTVKHSPEGSTIRLEANDQKIKIINRTARSNSFELNKLLANKQVNSKSSGMGLQIANDLAASIRVKIYFEQPDDSHLAAVMSWAE